MRRTVSLCSTLNLHKTVVNLKPKLHKIFRRSSSFISGDYPVLNPTKWCESTKATTSKNHVMNDRRQGHGYVCNLSNCERKLEKKKFSVSNGIRTCDRPLLC